jgi:hypothetical protein
MLASDRVGSLALGERVGNALPHAAREGREIHGGSYGNPRTS